MANRERGEVSFQVDGTSYTLVMSINGILEVEDAASAIAGQPMLFDQVGRKVAEGNVRYLRVLFWGLLRKYHRDLTLDEVGDLIDAAGGLIGIQRLITTALDASAPDEADKKALGADKDRPRRARAVTGSGGTGTSLRAGSV